MKSKTVLGDWRDCRGTACANGRRIVLIARDKSRGEIAVARLLAGCWRFKVGCRKFTDGCAVQPFC
jgi:hypothetical protein